MWIWLSRWCFFSSRFVRVRIFDFTAIVKNSNVIIRVVWSFSHCDSCPVGYLLLAKCWNLPLLAHPTKIWRVCGLNSSLFWPPLEVFYNENELSFQAHRASHSQAWSMHNGENGFENFKRPCRCCCCFGLTALNWARPPVCTYLPACLPT